MSDQVTEPSFDITTGWYFWVSLDEATALDQLLERCPLANKPLQSILHRLRGSAKAQGFRLQATENASASARSPRSPSSDDESLSCCSIDGSIAAEETEEESLETAQSSGITPSRARSQPKPKKSKHHRRADYSFGAPCPKKTGGTSLRKWGQRSRPAMALAPSVTPFAVRLGSAVTEDSFGEYASSLQTLLRHGEEQKAS
ncbi:uncharacterized protein B0H18DRAFT_1129863 [Fomitopsis serialis]|uniref:uncharacterized protein n=1 Tax=Fomitopsis serialis TaxID=139415 RepID=UPI00200869ED|nr:uncharacterized protein B0H18DRAFT_1129863 [Neoantrodia serialis]KAH9910547.1 hypothetical protein B0H18DRAFT_1129863 [Neoantrodia serialis]